MDPSNPASTLDFMLRQGFLDNLISDEVFSMEGCLIDSLINNISNNAGHMDIFQLKKVILDELNLIRDVHKLGLSDNPKTKEFLLGLSHQEQNLLQRGSPEGLFGAFTLSRERERL